MEAKIWIEAVKKIDRGTVCMLQDLFTAMQLEYDAIDYWDRVIGKDYRLEDIEVKKEDRALILKARYLKNATEKEAIRTIRVQTRPFASPAPAEGAILHITYHSVDLSEGVSSERVFVTDILLPSAGEFPEAIVRRFHDFQQ